MDLPRFLEEASDATDARNAFDRLACFAQGLGFPWTAYGSLTDHKDLAIPTPSYPAVFLNYPVEWQARYFERGYEKIDPVLSQSLRQAAAFQWSDIRRSTTTDGEERRVLDEAADFGLKGGITVPLHGPNCSLAVVSFAEESGQAIAENRVVQLQAAAQHFRSVSTRLLVRCDEDPDSPILSRRERECLYWSAMGKSSWDTGTILGISPNTVNHHIKNAMRKLETGSRIAAIVRAIQKGLLLV